MNKGYMQQQSVLSRLKEEREKGKTSLPSLLIPFLHYMDCKIEASGGELRHQTLTSMDKCLQNFKSNKNQTCDKHCLYFVE